MKIPKVQKRFCPKCKKHTEHKTSEAKKKTRSSVHTQGYGSRVRAKKRGVRGSGGHGKYSKPAMTKWKMAGKKQSKKTDLRYTCKECKKTSIQKNSVRTRRLELV